MSLTNSRDRIESVVGGRETIVTTAKVTVNPDISGMAFRADVHDATLSQSFSELINVWGKNFRAQFWSQVRRVWEHFFRVVQESGWKAQELSGTSSGTGVLPAGSEIASNHHPGRSFSETEFVFHRSPGTSMRKPERE